MRTFLLQSLNSAGSFTGALCSPNYWWSYCEDNILRVVTCGRKKHEAQASRLSLEKTCHFHFERLGLNESMERWCGACLLEEQRWGNMNKLVLEKGRETSGHPLPWGAVLVLKVSMFRNVGSERRASAAQRRASFLSGQEPAPKPCSPWIPVGSRMTYRLSPKILTDNCIRGPPGR